MWDPGVCEQQQLSEGVVNSCYFEIFIPGLIFIYLLFSGFHRLVALRKEAAPDSSASASASASKATFAKLILSILSSIVPIIDSLFWIFRAPTYPIYFIRNSFFSLSWLFSILIISSESARFKNHNWVLKSFWTISFITNASILQLSIGYQQSFSLFLTFFSISLSLSLGLMGLFSSSSPHSSYSKLSDIDSTSSSKLDFKHTKRSLWARLTFSWLGPLLRLGFKQPLEIHNLGDLPQELDGIQCSEKLKNYWQDQLRHPKPSLFRACFNCHWKQWSIGIFFKLMQDALLLSQPFIVKFVISYIQSPPASRESTHGLLYVLLLFSAMGVQSLSLAHYFNRMYVIGAQVRMALISMVYQKGFYLSNSVRQQTSVGEIVNVQSVDAMKLQETIPYLNMLWSAPLQLIVGIAFLWQMLGPSVIVGVGTIFLFMPVTFFGMKVLGKLQKELMGARDSRLKTMNELLNAIKVVKLFSWEQNFLESLTTLRGKELNVLKRQIIPRSIFMFSFSALPILVSVFTFGVYSLTGHELTPSIVFPALAMFNVIRFPIAMLPNVLNQLVETVVSLRRVQALLLKEEIDRNAVKHCPELESDGEALSVLVEDGKFSWEGLEPVVSGINIKVPRGAFIGIVGPVGCGKSTILSSMIGDTVLLQGKVLISGNMVYVPQTSWIQNASLKDNILFASPFDSEQYQKAIDSCQLAEDIRILPHGELTEIGEKGINLSGGQKQRVSLARAVFQDADVYLLDDTFSAVDSHVGQKIMDNCLLQVLAKKTRILVTHQLQYTAHCDLIYCIDDGKIVESGTYEELNQAGGTFSQLIRKYVKEKEKEEKGEDVPAQVEKAPQAASTRENPHDLMTEEWKEVGAVDWKVYKRYLINLGGICFFATLYALFVFDYASKIVGDFWLAYWTDNPGHYSLFLFLFLFSLLNLAAVGFMFFRSFIFYRATLRSSKVLHDGPLKAVLRSPMLFFDTIPLGRILNRFSSSIVDVDETLPRSFLSLNMALVNLAGTLIVVIIVSPFFVTVLLPLAYIYLYIQKYFIQSSRELKRLDQVWKSPVFAQFQESLQGVSTIRSFGMVENFQQENHHKISRNIKAYYYNQIANRWLGIRIEFLGAFVVTFSTLFAVVDWGNISPGSAGLAISYALSFTQMIAWLVRMISDTETQMVSAERLIEYSRLPSEAPGVIESIKLPQSWPDQGRIEFDNVSLRYRPGLDLVLNGVSLVIPPRHSVGICGRTGAGKSSLITALFRIVELAEGSIVIDGVDISTIGLEDLRGRMAIIPQDAVLFSGTVRLNLDPFDQYSDGEIWDSLENVSMKNTIKKLEGGLEENVSELGENFSVGERQLLCLARALLRKAKVLILDEATAAVDYHTDTVIQTTLRRVFNETTILTIAHRVNTILDYDLILVLDEGCIKEFDSPKNLLCDPESFFSKMVEESSTKS